MRYDGSITVGTQVDDTGLDKGIADLEKKVDDIEDNIEVTADVNENESIDKIKKFLEATKDLVRENELTLNANFNNDEAAREALSLLTQMQDVVDEINSEREINPDFDESDLLKYLVKINDLSSKLEALKKEKVNINFGNIERQLDNISNKIEHNVKKVGRWALSIFGIGTALNFVRSSMSTLSSYNEQIGTDIEYIRFLLATTLQPLIENIIRLVYTLLSYIGYIAKAWFGVNLFANGTVENFNKMNKGAEKVGKTVASIKKQLAGFDEMNVLQDNGNVNAGGGGGGIKTPSFDPSLFEGETPQWLKWLADHGQEIVEILSAIGVGLLALQWGLSPLQSLGAAVFTYELIQIIKDIKELIEDPSWENFAQLVKDIAGSLMGLGLLIGGNVGTKIAGLGLIIWGIVDGIQALIDYFEKLDGSLEDNGTSWEDFGRILTDISFIIAGIGILTGNLPLIIAGAIGLIVGLVLSNWEKISDILKNAEKFIIDILNWIERKFGIVGTGLKSIALEVVNYIKDHFTGMFLPIKNVFDGILLMLKGDFQNGIKNVFRGIGNFIIGVINKLIDGFNVFMAPLRTAIVAVGKATGKNLTIENVRVPRISYLKQGGIINLPSRGVPVGINAIGGEHGAEGVIPLTDSQQMELLGEAIGKYITVNNVLNNYMNGRLISRELQKSDNESNFAFNK